MTTAIANHSRRRVAYYYDADIGNFFYGDKHSMKPYRIKMTHNLLVNYGLYRKLEIHRPPAVTLEEMTKFHSDDYMLFLKNVETENIGDYSQQMKRFNVGSRDCPVFDGLFEFCQLSSGGSIAAATLLNQKRVDIAINWAGGLHHAKASAASGFCYTNDCVLAILELLKCHQRVLYVDIDVHHGDGVEEAFYTTDRVMTVSFHKYGNSFFPGTGHVGDVGMERGCHYAVNVPLRDGIDDASYEQIFQPVMQKVVTAYQPAVIVLQCGADSLAGDQLGRFNLTVKGLESSSIVYVQQSIDEGHGMCVEYLKKFNLPLLMLGGGGYTLRNVARCWTYETALALDSDIANELPYNDYFDYYGPDFKLHTTPTANMTNHNTVEYLDKVKERIFESLRQIPHAPGVQMLQGSEPDSSTELLSDEFGMVQLDEASPDERIPEALEDMLSEDEGELYDGEREGGDQRNRNSTGCAYI